MSKNVKQVKGTGRNNNAVPVILKSKANKVILIIQTCWMKAKQASKTVVTDEDIEHLDIIDRLTQKEFISGEEVSNDSVVLSINGEELDEEFLDVDQQNNQSKKDDCIQEEKEHESDTEVENFDDIEPGEIRPQ